MRTTDRAPVARRTIGLGAPRPGRAAASPRFGRVLLAGAVVGAADALFAQALQLAYAGVFAPATIFQGIASGLLGPAALEGGVSTAMVGVALHFGFAYAWVLTYAIAYRVSSALRDASGRWPDRIELALLFGALVWTVMNYVAKPIGDMSPTPVASVFFFVMLLGHAAVVGLPTVLLVRGRAELGSSSQSR